MPQTMNCAGDKKQKKHSLCTVGLCAVEIRNRFILSKMKSTYVLHICLFKNLIIITIYFKPCIRKLKEN